MRRLLLGLMAALAAQSAMAADLTQTAANVKTVGTDAKVSRVRYGEAVTQGMPVYLKESDGKYYNCDSDGGLAEAAAAVGIALTPGSTNEYGYVVTEGSINVGASLTVGEIYVVSNTAGKICPEADLSTGERVTILGVATSSSLLLLNPYVSGAAIP